MVSQSHEKKVLIMLKKKRTLSIYSYVFHHLLHASLGFPISNMICQANRKYINCKNGSVNFVKNYTYTQNIIEQQFPIN